MYRYALQRHSSRSKHPLDIIAKQLISNSCSLGYRPFHWVINYRNFVLWCSFRRLEKVGCHNNAGEFIASPAKPVTLVANSSTSLSVMRLKSVSIMFVNYEVDSKRNVRRFWTSVCRGVESHACRSAMFHVKNTPFSSHA